MNNLNGFFAPPGSDVRCFRVWNQREQTDSQMWDLRAERLVISADCAASDRQSSVGSSRRERESVRAGKFLVPKEPMGAQSLSSSPRVEKIKRGFVKIKY